MKEFKLIVAGSRGFTNYEVLSDMLHHVVARDFDDDVNISIVSGMARGADQLAARFARENGVMLHEFPANWDKWSKSAGYIRNVEMGNFADGLLAFWDGYSVGTKHMIDFMNSIQKQVVVVHL